MPTYTVLLDVGTIAGDDSIYKLIRSMERNHQIGGVAGEIAVDKTNWCNPTIAAQHFEYKISNIMDKSLESVLGFISVLPGAFSAYRYEAIRAENGAGPLPSYFLSLTSSTKELGPFKGNMYLAEDRILCFELLARKNKCWTMHYVKDAIARTDVPTTLVDLIKQRRRWLNGSFFAGLFAIMNFGRVWTESSHSFPRKCVFTLQFLYLTIQNLLSWFLLSNLFLTFYYVLLLALFERAYLLFQMIFGIYMVLVAGLIIFALGNKPDRRAAVLYTLSQMYFGLVMLTVSGLSIYGLVVGQSLDDPRDDLPTCSTTEFELYGGVVAALGFLFISSILHGEYEVLFSTIQYFFMLPSFVNILGVYAYSNLHDLSWGTKGLEAGSGHGSDKGTKGKGDIKAVLAAKKRQVLLAERAAAEKEDVDNSFRVFRSILLLTWLGTNSLWLYFMINFVSSSCYLKYLAFVVAGFNTIRVIGSIVFLLLRVYRRLIPGGNSANRGDASSTLPPEWAAHYQQTKKSSREPQTGAESRISIDDPQVQSRFAVLNSPSSI